MPTKGKPIPDGFHTVTPYMIVKNAAKALDFYREALGATERFRMAGPNGKIMHSELQVGSSIVWLADEFPEMGAVGAVPGTPGPVSFNVYVEDCDRVFERMVASGAKVIRPLADQFYGDRSGMVEDPFGHRWNISTHKWDMSEQEIKEGQEKAFGSGEKH